MGNADWVRGYFIGVDNGWGYGDIKPKIDIGFSINGRSPNCLVYNGLFDYPNLKMMVQVGFQSHGGTPLFIA